MEAVAKMGIDRAELQREKAGKPAPATKKKAKKDPPPDYPGLIQGALRLLGVESVKEFYFLPDRRYRFDLAIPELKIAIEYEGIHMDNKEKSRHTVASGYAEDCRKYNLAVFEGWRLLRYTTADTGKTNWEFAIASEIAEFIKILKNEGAK